MKVLYKALPYMSLNIFLYPDDYSLERRMFWDKCYRYP
jgi:hypothetical protein